MLHHIQRIKDVVTGRAKPKHKRSGRWRKVRKQYLADNPNCECCGGRNKVEVHHIVPFHEDPSRELDPTNLMTLCERKKYGINCHLLVGHLGNYRRRNTNAVADAITWNRKLKPHGNLS